MTYPLAHPLKPHPNCRALPKNENRPTGSVFHCNFTCARRNIHLQIIPKSGIMLLSQVCANSPEILAGSSGLKGAFPMPDSGSIRCLTCQTSRETTLGGKT